MNPNPLLALNHFTVPCSLIVSPLGNSSYSLVRFLRGLFAPASRTLISVTSERLAQNFSPVDDTLTSINSAVERRTTTSPARLCLCVGPSTAVSFLISDSSAQFSHL